jgi:hypothetical protein
MLDRERLIKLLNMTESQYDAEALIAIRRSNALLRKSKTSWAELLAQPHQPAKASPPSSPSPETGPERKPNTEPRQKPANWGADLYGDEPSIPPVAPAKDKAANDKAAARARIRSIPIFYRLMFFPIWAVSETYVTSVHKERFGTQLVSIIAPLAVGAFTGLVWFAIVKAVVKILGG